MKRPLLLLFLIAAQQLLLAQESILQLHSYQSARLKRTVNYYILLPPGYNEGSDRFPVLYMLRGAEWEWITPTQDGSRGGRTLQTVVDDLFAKRKIGKMIYVLPGLSQPATDAELAAMAYEMFPYIDSVYRTVPTRWHRGVDGFSYGGLDEMNVVAVRSDAFATAGSYDGSFFAFDFNRVLGAQAEQAHALDGIRFLHHSGARSGSTNYPYVRQLVDSMAARGWENEFSEIQLAPNAVHSWWFADEHMLVTLPLHWETFDHPPKSLHPLLAAPLAGDRVAGTVNVAWSIASLPASSRVFVEYSADRGKTWKALFSGPASVQSFAWNTTSVSDGAWYTLRVSVVADTAFGQTQLLAPLTIDNPGNGAPAAEILSLAPGDTVQGQWLVHWDASDPEGDSLSFSLDFSPDGGSSWEPLAADLKGTNEYLWDSRESPNSPSAILRVRCSDGQASTETQTGCFLVHNSRGPLAPALVNHRAGKGDGTLFPRVVDPGKVLQHTYEVTFADSAGKAARFSVRDLTSKTQAIGGAPLPAAGGESRAFDGIRLEFAQPEQPVFSPDSSRWLTGSSTLLPLVTLPRFASGDSTIRGTAYGADYLITVSDRIVDTSGAEFGAVPVPMRFTVQNITENRKARVVFGDQDADGQLDGRDEIVILETSFAGVPLVTWDLLFTSLTEPVLPVAGDMFFLKILKPFSSRDTLEFTPVISAFSPTAVLALPERFVLYQNSPNPFNPSTTIRYTLPRRSRVTLSVFTVLGQKVADLVRGDVDAGSHEVWFNANNLASGVYFYRLQAGSFTDVKKLLLVR